MACLHKVKPCYADFPQMSGTKLKTNARHPVDFTAIHNFPVTSC